MALADFFADIYNLITSSILCLFATIIIVVLLFIIIIAWRISRIHAEMGWLHQPLFGPKK